MNHALPPRRPQPNKPRARARIAALLSCLTFGATAQAETANDAEASQEMVRFSGFGTLGMVHNRGDGSNFVRDISQPKGATNRGVSFDVDSRLGLQINIKPSEHFEGVLQVLSRYRYDNGYRPDVSWAFLKYSPNDTITLRGGRLGYDAYMSADSQSVGYSYLWVRPPVEYYGALPPTHFDGVDAVLRTEIARGVAKFKLYSGKASESLPMDTSFGTTGYVDLHKSDIIGGHLEYQDEHWTARIGHSAIQIHNELPVTNFYQALEGAAQFFGLPELTTLSNDFRLANKKITYSSIGLAYDNGPLQTQASVNRMTSQSLMFSESNAAYLSVGYRFGEFTPYAMLARIKSKPSARAAVFSTFAVPIQAALAPLRDGVITSLITGQAHQNTLTLGVRYDFKQNAALKFQIDHIRNHADSHLLWPRSSSYPNWNGSANVISAALDFTF